MFLVSSFSHIESLSKAAKQYGFTFVYVYIFHVV